MLLKFNVDSPFVSRSDQKIGKNIFEFREKYFRISNSIDRRFRFRFHCGVAKEWGKFGIVEDFLKKIASELMADGSV